MIIKLFAILFIILFHSGVISLQANIEFSKKKKLIVNKCGQKPSTYFPCLLIITFHILFARRSLLAVFDQDQDLGAVREGEK